MENIKSTREILTMVNRIIRNMETKGFTRTDAVICLATATALISTSQRLRTNEDSIRPTWSLDDNKGGIE